MSQNDPENGIRDAGFDEWVEATAEDESYYLECANGHGSLPPRRVCPEPGCNSSELTERPLPETGEIETYTVTAVPTPSFEDDAPYAVAIADFGPVRLTGQVVDTDLEEVESGMAVALDIRTSETDGERIVAFRPR